MDCSLNGQCSGAVCVCDAGWMGSSCETMSLGPAEAASLGGAYGVLPNVTSWGGNVVFENGSFHLFVTEIAYGCHLRFWGVDSTVTHAVSENPLGPYKKLTTALLPEAHNPHIIRLPDSSYALFHIGKGDNSSYAPCGEESAVSYAANVVHVSKSLNGPWVAMDLGIDCTNPSPMIHPQNNSLYLMCNAQGGFHLYRTPSLGQPWTLVVVLPSHPLGIWEDPFLYMDVDGDWHVLAHAYNFTNGSVVAGHYFSTEGLEWTAGEREPFYNYAQLDNGSVVQFQTRERPKIWFDETGTPKYLFSGVSTNKYCAPPAVTCKTRAGYDWTYTFVQPIT